MKVTIEKKKSSRPYFEIKVPGVSEQVPSRDEAKAFTIENIVKYKAMISRKGKYMIKKKSR